MASNALKKPVKLAPKLASFVGAPEMSRADVTKKIWDYIKANNLQDPANRKEINCDATLKDIMGSDRINMLKIATAINPYFLKD